MGTTIAIGMLSPDEIANFHEAEIPVEVLTIGRLLDAFAGLDFSQRGVLLPVISHIDVDMFRVVQVSLAKPDSTRVKKEDVDLLHVVWGGDHGLASLKRGIILASYCRASGEIADAIPYVDLDKCIGWPSPPISEGWNGVVRRINLPEFPFDRVLPRAPGGHYAS